MTHHRLDALDKKILKLIAGDARIPFLEVARVCNVSGAAIHQRIQKLNNLGVLKGSQFIIDPEKIGYILPVYSLLPDKSDQKCSCRLCFNACDRCTVETGDGGDAQVVVLAGLL